MGENEKRLAALVAATGGDVVIDGVEIGQDIRDGIVRRAGEKGDDMRLGELEIKLAEKATKFAAVHAAWMDEEWDEASPLNQQLMDARNELRDAVTAYDEEHDGTEELIAAFRGLDP